MGSLKKGQVETTKIINDLEYKKVDGLNFNVFYNVHEIEEINKFRSFVCHLILEDTLRVPIFKKFYEIQELALIELKDRFPEVNKMNSRVYVIYELKKDIKYMPDISMFNYGQEFTKKLEKQYDVNLAYKVAIINNPKSRSAKLLGVFKNIYNRFFPFGVVYTVEDAYKAIRNYNKNK